MKPVKTNLFKKRCVPTSADCIIWDGPALCCIPECNGDTVADIIKKLSQEICYHRALLDLSTLDMGDIVVADKKLITVLQAIIDKLNEA